MRWVDSHVHSRSSDQNQFLTYLNHVTAQGHSASQAATVLVNSCPLHLAIGSRQVVLPNQCAVAERRSSECGQSTQLMQKWEMEYISYSGNVNFFKLLNIII